MKNPLVSVIIPPYNSEKTLDRCLKSIRNQNYKNIEIIVVDADSFDKTKQIAKNYTTKVFNSGPERTHQKNFGIKISKGKYVFFVDSDMSLTKNIIREAVNLIELDKKIGGIIIPESSVGKGFWVKVRGFERSFYSNTPIESARFFRKNLASKVKGFDEGIIFFEESTLPQKIEKLGYDVKLRIKSEIKHHENFSMLRWLKKKYYYSKTASNYENRYKKYAENQMNIIRRFSLFLKDGRFYSRPILALGVIILKLLEYISAGSGYIVGRLIK